MTDTRKQVEREIAEWLLDQALKPAPVDRSLLMTLLWGLFRPIELGKQHGRIFFAIEAKYAIERGEYRKDEA